MASPTPTPTPEQQHAASLYDTGAALRIEALAGTGKTTTLGQLLARGSPRGGKILLTAFGNRVVAEAKERFASAQVWVKTNHGLAWAVGAPYKQRDRLRNRVTATDLLAHFAWTDQTFAPHADARAGAYGVLETITAFCQTADPAIRNVHALPSAYRQTRGKAETAHRYAYSLAELAREAWAAMLELRSTLPITHDVYLKKWALGEPHLNFGTIMLDEAQDANGVMIGVLRQQEHAQLVVVGDRRQAIFGWRGSQDALDAFDIRQSCALTQSFRFGPEIAALANAILARQCESDVFLRGDPRQPGRVGPHPAPRTYLARKNATLIGVLMDLQRANPSARVGVVGGVDDLIKLVNGAAALRRYEPTTVPDLAEFSNWNDVKAAIEHEAYSHLRVLVNLVEGYGTPTLLNALESIRGHEADEARCQALLSTAHRSKGREWPSCRLLDDFAVQGPPDDVGLYGWTPEDGNLLYVASTRAREHLDVSECQSVIDSWGDLPFPGERELTAEQRALARPAPTQDDVRPHGA